MYKQNKLIAAAVLASAMAAATGCDATMFTQANNTLKTIQTAGKSVGNARLPTAAIAASMGGLKMMEALSLDGKEAKSSGIIAAGSGNIIAAGSGNIIAAGSGNYFLSALEPGKDQTKPVTGDGIKDGKVEYSSNLEGETRWVSTIKNFTCNSQGYDLAASGKFVYDSNGNQIECTMNGSIKHENKLSITLSDLKFQSVDPLPTNDPDFGGFTLTTKDGDDEYKFVASIRIEDSKIVAEADSFVNGKKNPDKVKFDQTNAGGTVAGAADAGVGGANAADKK